ncbi:GntR family transcriptional regulator [Lampropedia aestuarii]|uniref:GntR family transcriptional regulator n=1 Tax=Lampropedia aestuarii TaxID=2562762 RepID=UPI002468C93C|nr:GntR family transcriptional regulator [Lampropedia aestuarii]MDH5856123.1 GntR family transcriptional regulator [Lampropedia aestuarii]
MERLYVTLRDMAMRYDFRPGERINEQALGREFGVSRAPLREALNRLVAEGWLNFVMNKGFYRKGISVDEVLDLYQVRIALERRAVLLAVQKASDAEIQSVHEYWSSVMSNSNSMTAADFLAADEEFHRRMVSLAKNKELSAYLEITARRIHSARSIELEQTDWNAKAFDAHYDVLKYMRQRELQKALDCITDHIDMSLNRAVHITKEMVAKFFLTDGVSAQSNPSSKPKL